MGRKLLGMGIAIVGIIIFKRKITKIAHFCCFLVCLKVKIMLYSYYISRSSLAFLP